MKKSNKFGENLVENYQKFNFSNFKFLNLRIF